MTRAALGRVTPARLAVSDGSITFISGSSCDQAQSNGRGQKGSMGIELSPIDKMRFGVETAKVALQNGDSVPQLTAQCREQAVEMLIARCGTADIDLVHAMEREGFELMDTLVYFMHKAISPSSVTVPEGLDWRFANEEDAAKVEACARAAFEGYFGHYHSDPKLNKRDADLVYSSWAAASCRSTKVADVVLVIGDVDHVAAFLTLKRIDADTAEIVLNAVLPRYQGHGLYSSLVGLAKNWCVQNEIHQLLVSTQVTNTAPQKVWCRHGFEPRNSIYTFHKWL